MVKTINSKEYILESCFLDRNTNEVNVLDIGSKNGEFINSLNLINKGCNAYLVEASPKLFDKAKNLHEINDNVKCFPFVIINNNGVVDFEEKDDSVIGSSEDILDEIIGHKYVNTNTVRVIGMDFYTFTITTNQNQFNLISINAGGKEYDILSQINLGAVGCEILIIEYNGKYKDMYVNYVMKFEMRLVFNDNKNLIFKK